MYLVERTTIKKSNPLYDELYKMTLLSKNLYNQVLYRVRQYFFKTSKYLNKYEIMRELAKERQIDYIALPRKVSQWVINQVDQNFKSFFELLNSKRNNVINRNVNIPKYLKKDARNVLTFTIQAISTKELKNGRLKLSGCKNSINVIHNENVKQARVIPKVDHFIVETIYSVDEKRRLYNGKCVGIDLGVNNLATVGGNSIKPFIINGKPLKSINQYFNKCLALLKSRQNKCKNKNVNKLKINTLYRKRNNKVNNYLHKSSRMLVNHLVSNGITKVVIGYNKEWKQDISLGGKNNQNFVQIPFNSFIYMISYKCRLEGIEVVQHEESYTSKCSFIDNEEICHHDKYLGKRIRRGLFRTKEGIIINADVNGALNILRKEIPNALDGNGIEVCNTPTVLTVK